MSDDNATITFRVSSGIKSLLEAARAIPELMDVGLKAPVAVRVLPIFYVVPPVLTLVNFLLVGCKLLFTRGGFGIGLWTVLSGVVIAFLLLIGLRILCECVARYLRS